MIYRAIAVAESEQVRLFLQRLGWGRRVDDPERFRLLIANSDRTMSAWEGDQLRGFARALCDEVSNGYVSMVAVDPSCHGQGIGRELILQLIGTDPRITWVLRAGKDSREFWSKLGFQPSTIAMERLRID
ncbi:MAG: GNAT family N-acetyltransferase [Ardenticatenales bacterium]|nr:GNAT family N-acetyltransferase [Ardenticatenales bacterium]